MGGNRTQWSVILTAISTYGGGFSVGSSCVSHFKIRQHKKRRKVSSFFKNYTSIPTTKSEPEEKNETPLIPCRNFDNGKGTCPFGNKCFFSHAIIAPLRPQTVTTEPIVDVEIFFKSLPKDAMTPESMRAFAEKFGVVTNVTFLPENAKAPGRIAGRVNMENEKLARQFEQALNNKMFKVNNQRVYVQAKIQKIDKRVPQIPTCVAIKSPAPSPQKMEPSDIFPIVPKSLGKQRMTPENLRQLQQISDDSRLATMMQMQEDKRVQECVTSKIYQLSKAFWPTLPSTPSTKTKTDLTPSTTRSSIYEEVDDKEVKKTPDNMEEWTTIKNGKRVVTFSEALPIHLPAAESPDSVSETSDVSVDDNDNATTVPTPHAPHTPKKLVLLDWIEYERERLKERNETKTWSKSSTVNTEVVFSDCEVVHSAEEHAPYDSDENDEDEDDDDSDAYDECYEMSSLVKLLPDRLRKRYL